MTSPALSPLAATLARDARRDWAAEATGTIGGRSQLEVVSREIVLGQAARGRAS